MNSVTINLDKWLACAALAVGLVASASATQIQEGEPPKGQARAEQVVAGLENPWAMAFLPNDAGILITERPGRLRLWNGAALSEPIKGVPAVFARSQGGLLDVAIAPDFEHSRRVYLAYAEQDERGRAGTAVGAGTLSADARALENFEVIFRQEPKLSSGQHFGARLVFDRQGDLFIALGENNQRPTSQDLDKLQGKLVRLRASGAVPDDNPFVGQSGARPEIWSYGHRNPQGAALNPWSGKLWLHEHGPRGGDEINIPEAGSNYGWPIATYGRNYSGLAIPEAQGADVEGMAPPLYVWARSPAVSGMAFYNADRHPQWRNSLFIGALKDRQLIRLQLDGERITAEERLLSELDARIRDVRTGPDGHVYVLTDAGDGALYRVSPQ